MNKRVLMCLFFLVILSLSLISFVLAQTDAEGVQKSLEGVKEGAEEIKTFTERDKWEFLADQWKEFLLKNKVFASIDDLLKRFSTVFFIFMGIQYDFSPLFFTVVFLWIFHLIILSDYIFLYLPLGKGIGFIISIGILVILSQLKYIIFVSEIALNIALWGQGVWRIVTSLLVIVFLIFVFFGLKRLKKEIERSREAFEKLKEKYNRKSLEEMAKAMRGEKGFMEKYAK